MKRKLLLLCVATLLALAATGQTPVRQKPPRGRWGAEVNTYVAPFIDGAISVDGIYNYAVADWFIVGAGAGVLHSATSYSNYTALMYGRAFVRLRFEVPKWRVSPVLLEDFSLGVLLSRQNYDTFWPESNFILGARFRLRNDDRITFGIGIRNIWVFMDVCLSPQDRPFISDIRFRGSTGFFVRSGMPVFASSDSSDCGSVRGWERNRSARAERSISEVRYKTDNCKWEAQDTSGHTTLLCSPAFRRIADVFSRQNLYPGPFRSIFIIIVVSFSLFTYF